MGCVGPARNDTDYRKKAVATTEHVRSSVRTVELAVQAAAEGDTFGPFLSRVIGQAEDDASSALNGFESIQPPSSRSDALRQQVDDVASDAIDAISEARTAARRSEIETLVGLRDKLRDAGDALEAFGEAHHV